ncbi:unnamed protein product [Prunus armeniaca]
MVQIKSYEEEHTCGIVERNVYANSSWLVERYSTQLSRIINWDVGAFKDKVNDDLCVIASRSQIYIVRKKATAVSVGTYIKSFESLWDYAEELKRTNVGNTIIIKSNLEGDKSRFHRIYICLAATKKGFIAALSPIVGLEACHIKGQHPVQLLSDVGVDPNNDMYLIAYAVAEVENYETWIWFLELLGVNLGIKNNNGYVFITDRQKGLIDAVSDMFPNSEHMHCLKHIHANFILAGHRGLMLKQHIEAAARSESIPRFQAEMKKFQDLLVQTFDWLVRLDPMQWCRSQFRTHSKCDIILNNISEAFKKSIIDDRDKPIITMLTRVRYYIMLLMASRSYGEMDS